jgi:hypothetical protein
LQKDGTKQQLHFGGRVVSSVEVRAEIKAKKDTAEVKERGKKEKVKKVTAGKRG